MNFVSPAGTRVVYPHVESKPKYIETVLFKRPARREDVIIRDEDQPPSKGLYSLSPVQKTNLNHTPVHAQHTHQSHPIPSITLTSKNHTVIIYGFPSNLTNESLQKFKQIGHCTATLIPSQSNYIELTYASLESVACALELNGEPLSRSNPGILIGVSQKKTMDGASGVIRSERIVSNASPRGVLRQGDKPRFGKSIENSPERHQGMGMNLGKRPQTTTQNGINSMSTANSINTANGTIVNQGVLRQDVMHGNTENSQNQTWSGYFRSMFLSDD